MTLGPAFSRDIDDVADRLRRLSGAEQAAAWREAERILEHMKRLGRYAERDEAERKFEEAAK